MTIRRAKLATCVLTISLALFVHNVYAQEEANPQQIVEQATKSVAVFAKRTANFRDKLKNATAVLIIPRLKKVGFIIGISGGYGVMMARNSSGGWNGPAFYRTGGGSIGLQAGAKVSAVIMLVMNEPALKKMLKAKYKLGGAASVVAGVGGGVGADVTADVLIYSRGAGVFGGMSLEGGGVEPVPAMDGTYYGQELTTKDILIDGKAGADKAAELRSALKAAAGG